MNEELLRVLDAREKRWQRRLALARGSRRTLITITLCVPVAYRTDPEFERLMLALGRRFRAFLRSRGVHYRLEGMDHGADGPALFLTTAAAPRRVKELCVRAEDLLGGGRMLDIDVMDPLGEPVSRGSLGLPPGGASSAGSPPPSAFPGRFTPPGIFPAGWRSCAGRRRNIWPAGPAFSQRRKNR